MSNIAEEKGRPPNLWVDRRLLRFGLLPALGGRVVALVYLTLLNESWRAKRKVLKGTYDTDEQLVARGRRVTIDELRNLLCTGRDQVIAAIDRLVEVGWVKRLTKERAHEAAYQLGTRVVVTVTDKKGGQSKPTKVDRLFSTKCLDEIEAEVAEAAGKAGFENDLDLDVDNRIGIATRVLAQHAQELAQQSDTAAAVGAGPARPEAGPDSPKAGPASSEAGPERPLGRAQSGPAPTPDGGDSRDGSPAYGAATERKTSGRRKTKKKDEDLSQEGPEREGGVRGTSEADGTRPHDNSADDSDHDQSSASALPIEETLTPTAAWQRLCERHEWSKKRNEPLTKLLAHPLLIQLATDYGKTADDAAAAFLRWLTGSELNAALKKLKHEGEVMNMGWVANLLTMQWEDAFRKALDAEKRQEEREREEREAEKQREREEAARKVEAERMQAERAAREAAMSPEERAVLEAERRMREEARRFSLEISGRWDMELFAGLIELSREYGIDRLRWIRTVGNVGRFGPADFIRLAAERIEAAEREAAEVEARAQTERERPRRMLQRCLDERTGKKHEWTEDQFERLASVVASAAAHGIADHSLSQYAHDGMPNDATPEWMLNELLPVALSRRQQEHERMVRVNAEAEAKKRDEAERLARGERKVFLPTGEIRWERAA